MRSGKLRGVDPKRPGTKKPTPAPSSASERKRRGPKPALSTERIVESAVDIADAEGLDAVTMQRLGEAFGFTAMSLYRYVRKKSDLVDAMIESALGPPPRLDGAWRARLGSWAERTLACFGRHPWLLEAT